nr:hypothetical protein [Azospirillum agricola]
MHTDVGLDTERGGPAGGRCVQPIPAPDRVGSVAPVTLATGRTGGEQHGGDQSLDPAGRRLAVDGGVGPEHRGGVADPQPAAAARRQQGVERRAILEGGGLRDRSVVALPLAVRGEGGLMEGDQRRPGFAGTPHALDGGVQAGNRRGAAGDQTHRVRPVAVGGVGFPERPRRRPVVQEAGVAVGTGVAGEAEGQGAVEQRRRKRWLCEALRGPAAQEAQQRPQAGVLGAGEKPLVPGAEGVGAGGVGRGLATLRGTAEPEDVTAVVPQEEGRRPDP